MGTISSKRTTTAVDTLRNQREAVRSYFEIVDDPLELAPVEYEVAIATIEYDPKTVSTFLHVLLMDGQTLYCTLPHLEAPDLIEIIKALKEVESVKQMCQDYYEKSRFEKWQKEQIELKMQEQAQAKYNGSVFAPERIAVLRGTSGAAIGSILGAKPGAVALDSEIWRKL